MNAERYFCFAPVVQRIEHQPSKLAMGVRFSPGAQALIYSDGGYGETVIT